MRNLYEFGNSNARSCAKPALQGTQSITLNDKLGAQKYYWKVMVKSKDSPVTYKSEIRSFTITSYPAPLIVSPTDQSAIGIRTDNKNQTQNLQTAVSFLWQYDLPTKEYHWLIAQDPQYKNKIQESFTSAMNATSCWDSLYLSRFPTTTGS